MKVFVSYAYTGEDEVKLRTRLSSLKKIFEELDIDYYINCFAPGWKEMASRNATGGEFLRFALNDMKMSDVVFVIQSSERRSEGMLMEVGAAVSMGKKIIVAQHVSSNGKTYLPTVADDYFEWETENDLIELTHRYFSVS